VIGYFDTSAVLPLVLTEPGSARCAELWLACDARVSSMLVIAESHAALAQARRLGRVTEEEYGAARELLDRRLDELDLVTLTRALAVRAGELAVSEALRGYDAVHAASALAVQGPDTVFVAGDKVLLTAMADLGMSTADTCETV